MTTKPISDQSFEQDVLKSPTPVLVDFWADWCAPCKMIAPYLEEIADEMEGDLTVAKMDVMANPATPQKYGVRGIPTMMIFKDGQLASTKVGATSKQLLQSWITDTIGS